MQLSPKLSGELLTWNAVHSDDFGRNVTLRQRRPYAGANALDDGGRELVLGLDE